MKQWDIFLFPFTEELPHPVVILSGDERVAARKHVNGLLCVSLRGRPLGLHEVLLDQADGLEWETAVRCVRAGIEAGGRPGFVAASSVCRASFAS